MKYKLILICLLFSNVLMAQSSTQAYNEASSMLPNPRSANQDFQFDYEVSMGFSASTLEEGSGTIYFNSADGTLCINDYTLLRNTGQTEWEEGFEFHDAILYPDGKIAIYGLETHTNQKIVKVIDNNAQQGIHLGSYAGGYNPSMQEVEKNQGLQLLLRSARRQTQRPHRVFGAQKSYRAPSMGGDRFSFWIADRGSRIAITPEMIAIHGFGVPILIKDHSTRKNKVVTRTILSGRETGTYTFSVKRINRVYNGNRYYTVRGSEYLRHNGAQIDLSTGNLNRQMLQDANDQYEQIKERFYGEARTECKSLKDQLHRSCPHNQPRFIRGVSNSSYSSECYANSANEQEVKRRCEELDLEAERKINEEMSRISDQFTNPNR